MNPEHPKKRDLNIFWDDFPSPTAHKLQLPAPPPRTHPCYRRTRYCRTRYRRAALIMLGATFYYAYPMISLYQTQAVDSRQHAKKMGMLICT